MRVLLIVAFLVAGCVPVPAARTAKDVDLSGVEPGCAERCTARYSDCIGQSSRAFGTINQARLVDACTDGLEACAKTCPKR